MDSDSDDEFGDGGFGDENDMEGPMSTSEWNSYGDHPTEYRSGGGSAIEDDAQQGEDLADYNDDPSSYDYNGEAEYHLSGLPDNYQWKSAAPKWEVPTQGEMGQRNMELEKDIFSHHLNAGINFKKYDDIPVQVTGNDVGNPISKVSHSFFKKTNFLDSEYLTEISRACSFPKPLLESSCFPTLSLRVMMLPPQSRSTASPLSSEAEI